ncbi:MAG: magnesium transporter [Planctomycetota bacterium]
MTTEPEDPTTGTPDAESPEPRSGDRPAFGDLERALGGNGELLAEFLADVHPADLAEWIEDLDEWQSGRIFEALDPEAKAELLIYAEDHVAAAFLARMTVPQIVEVIEHLPADEAVDLLALTDDATYESVLRAVDLERATGLRKLASYDADSAGGLMTTEYVTVPFDSHVSDAIKVIKSDEGPAGDEGTGVFVVDEDGKPVGYVTDRELLMTPMHTPIGDVMDDDLITVDVADDQEDVANQVLKYSLAAVGVVDSTGRLVGVIDVDDAQEVLEGELEEDLLRLVGTSPADQTRLPVWTRVRHRLPLMALTVLGGLVSAKILQIALGDEPHPTEGVTSPVSILRYLPIIIGLAGNVGIQSSTILVRAFATGELVPGRGGALLASEVLVGAIIGVLCGAASASVAMFMEASEAGLAVGFGVALGLAILFAMTWAAFLGCAVPFACQRFRIDPAIAAGPFLIVLSDISGAAIFVGIASIAL